MTTTDQGQTAHRRQTVLVMSPGSSAARRMVIKSASTHSAQANAQMWHAAAILTVCADGVVMVAGAVVATGLTMWQMVTRAAESFSDLNQNKASGIGQCST